MNQNLNMSQKQRNLLVSFANVWVITIPVLCTTGDNL